MGPPDNTPVWFRVLMLTTYLKSPLPHVAVLGLGAPESDWQYQGPNPCLMLAQELHEAEQASPALHNIAHMVDCARRLAAVTEGMHRVLCIFRFGIWGKVQCTPSHPLQ